MSASMPVLCKEHPKYKALERPKVPCAKCWTVYTIALEQLHKYVKKEEQFAYKTLKVLSKKAQRKPK